VGHLNTIIREVTRNKESRLRQLEQKLLDSPGGEASPGAGGAGHAPGGTGVAAAPAVDTREMFEGFT
jgi:hypothetical protein